MLSIIKLGFAVPDMEALPGLRGSLDDNAIEAAESQKSPEKTVRL